jgi:hypothetical protein
MYRLNHMAMTFPRGTFTEEFYNDLKSFYGGVFGWDVAMMQANAPQSGEDDSDSSGAGAAGYSRSIIINFDPAALIHLVLFESETPMTTPANFEHLGILVNSNEEVHALLDKVRKLQETDDRIVINGVWDEWDLEGATGYSFDNGFVSAYLTTGFNVKYLMPIAWDVSCNTWKEGREPKEIWQWVTNENRLSVPV